MHHTRGAGVLALRVYVRGTTDPHRVCLMQFCRAKRQRQAHRQAGRPFPKSVSSVGSDSVEMVAQLIDVFAAVTHRGSFGPPMVCCMQPIHDKWLRQAHRQAGRPFPESALTLGLALGQMATQRAGVLAAAISRCRYRLAMVLTV